MSRRYAAPMPDSLRSGQPPELSVRCPWCRAPAGDRCRTPRGRKLTAPSHDARITAWTDHQTDTKETATP